jgi:hypothetical protein
LKNSSIVKQFLPTFQLEAVSSARRMFISKVNIADGSIPIKGNFLQIMGVK